MNQRQQYLLGLLKEIDTICRRNDISYVLVGGSLIGALRSKGFLPWDDDADIAMSYDNYLRFKEACATQLPPNRVLTAPELQEDCAVLIPRYTSTDTTLIHPAQSLHSCPAGEVIDIFILDPVADGPQAQSAYEEKLCMLHEMCNYASIAANRYCEDASAFERYEAVREQEGQLAVCRQLCAEIEGLFDPQGSRYLYRWQGCVTSYPRSWFDSTVDVEFEGCSFMAPAQFNSYLTLYFGEEWSELPGDITASKHDAAASLEMPADDARALYTPPFDNAEMIARLRQAKGLALGVCAEANRLRDDVARARAACAALELQRHLSCVGDAFDAAYAAKDGRALAGLLSDYLAAQTHKALIGRRAYTHIYRFRKPVLVQVPDRVFEAALWALMETGRMTYAQRLLSIREQQGLALTPAMTETKQALKIFRSSVEALVNGQLDEGLLTSSLAAKRHPHVSAFLKLVCVFLQRMGEPAQPRLQRALTAARERYPWDGFFLKVDADLLWDQGSYEEARRRYLSAAESTRNGFALLDIRARTGYWPRWMRESSWGSAYGIPAWEDVEPQPLPAAPRPAAPDLAPAPQAHLYELLKKAARLCDKLGVAYYLAPEAHSALMRWGKLPSAMRDYALVVGKAGAGKLADALAEGALPGLRMELAPLGAPEALYICDDQTLFLDLSGSRPAQLSCLAVSVRIEGMAQNQGLQAAGLTEKLKLAFAKNGGLKAAPLRAADAVSGCSFCVRSSKAPKLKRPATAFAAGPNVIVSTTVSAAQMEAAGAVPPDYFERRAAVLPQLEQAAQAQREHRAAFKQLKLADQSAAEPKLR